jgi:Ni/Fe-hydrogenase b-type cytochrome subunit
MAPLTKRTHWVVRVTHWINVIALPLMVASGLRIFNAYPAFARKGETFCCYPFAGKTIPAALTFGGWLAGARHWHFAVMWVLVANALVYLGFLYLHGEWRDLAPRRGDAHRVWEMIEFYLFARQEHPHQGKHNALQKIAYFAMPIIAGVIVLSGVAIWKPVQLHWLTMIFGGYVWARYVHFAGMVLLVLLVLGHVFMVFAVDPYALRSMITGWYDEDLSPEARNARPFYHLLPRRKRAVGRATPKGSEA